LAGGQGSPFSALSYDYWIAFILLLVIGGKMISECICGIEEKAPIDVLRIFPLMALSLATSIDALAIGVRFGILRNAGLIPALIIGIVCGVLSFAGVILGE
jgi:manganese efflux pump family protein